MKYDEVLARLHGEFQRLGMVQPNGLQRPKLAQVRSPNKERVTSMNINITKNIGMLLLAAWLILTGLAAFIPAIGGLGVILAILAIAAGVFILLQR